MKRKIIEINEELCNGCGLCIPNCHEGALQVIDGKARLISDLFCDGLGACIGHCPEGAISIIEREADAYDEVKVMTEMVKKGKNTILAHLKHLKDHNEDELLRQAVKYIKDNQIDMYPDGLDKPQPVQKIYTPEKLHGMPVMGGGSACGCSGSAPQDFRIDLKKVEEAGNSVAEAPSELRQWPVQLHLLNPQAGYFKNADVVLAADCVAFSMGNFHNRFLKGKTLAIACPKLDSNKESYVDKLAAMISDSGINTLTVVVMEVPCCSGLLQLAKMAMNKAGRNIPIKRAEISVQGEIIEENWINY